MTHSSIYNDREFNMSPHLVIKFPFRHSSHMISASFDYYTIAVVVSPLNHSRFRLFSRAGTVDFQYRRGIYQCIDNSYLSNSFL